MNMILKTISRFSLFSILLLSVACSTHEKDPIVEIAYKVWTYSISHPDGFTIEIPSAKPVTSGFAVGYYTGVHYIGKESLSAVITHSLKHNKIVGGWFDTDDGLYYFDSIRIFDDDSQKQAHQFAIENKQKAYYDLTNNVTIYINIDMICFTQ